jgi:hypothetical protein
MKPWNDAAFTGEIDEDAIEALWAATTADEFYFALSSAFEGDPGTRILFCPVEYYEENEYQFDQYTPISHLLPVDFKQECEAIFSSPRSWDEIRADLLARGFQENDEFSSEAAEE